VWTWYSFVATFLFIVSYAPCEQMNASKQSRNGRTNQLEALCIRVWGVAYFYVMANFDSTWVQILTRLIRNSGTYFIKHLFNMPEVAYCRSGWLSRSISRINIILYTFLDSVLTWNENCNLLLLSANTSKNAWISAIHISGPMVPCCFFLLAWDVLLVEMCAQWEGRMS
jgi:hypothetical protein